MRGQRRCRYKSTPGILRQLANTYVRYYKLLLASELWEALGGANCSGTCEIYVLVENNKNTNNYDNDTTTAIRR